MRRTRPQMRSSLVAILVLGIVTSSIAIPSASALTGLNLVVDYTPDSATVATSALRGTKIDLTASTPVAVAGTTQQEIIQQIDPELDLRSASEITAPIGWTIYYSTDGVTYTSTAPTTLAAWEALRYVKANGPLVSAGADANGRQIANTTSSGMQPDSGQFSISGGSSGDGWDITFDDMSHFYNVTHHQPRSSVDCHLRTGARCDASWPYVLSGGSMSTNGGFELASSNMSSSWYDSVQKELWVPVIYRRNVSGTEISTAGFACLALTTISAATKWCGGSITTGFVSPGVSADFPSSATCGADALYDCYQGIAQSAGRLFTWNVKTGDLICIDIRLNSGAGGPCASGGLIDFGASLPNANNANYYAYLGEWGGRIYGATDETSGTVYGVCVVAVTGAACPGWTNPRVIADNTARFGQLPATTLGGAVRGACFFGSATRSCFDAAGLDINSSLTTSFTNNYQSTIISSANYSNFNPTYGTRMFWGDGRAGALGTIHCWDFSLDNWCTNWTAAGIADENYQIVLDPAKPTCLWSNDNSGNINTFNTTTGVAGNCAVPATNVDFSGAMILPRMACSASNAIQSWRSFTLVTAVTYTSATFTVKDSSGGAITAWTNKVMPANKIVDLATLPITDTGQSPTFSVVFSGRTTEGDVSATISAIGGSPELCLRPTIACPAPIVAQSQLLANNVNVIASGSTTAGSVVSQFDPVTRAVSIAQTPSSTCASSLTGNLSTGAGVAVAGVVVALTDSAGSAVTYQADYPDVALRGLPVTATSDASGNYSFPLVAPGNYKVQFVDASATVTVNQAIVTASGSGTTSDFTAATSLLSPTVTLVAGTPGVVDGKYNSSQTLSKSFWPSTVNAGQTSVLTFTITNPALTAKSGIGWVDSLPTGLVVDDNPDKRTTCPGGVTETATVAAMTPVAGATSITVTGASINANVSSCTFRVNVKATVNGSFINGPSNVSTSTIDKNTNATLTALTSPVGATLCDNNNYYLDSGQLYRQEFGSVTRYAIGPAYTSGSVDAIGYNSVDGFLYGIAKSTTTSNGVVLTLGHLVRISNTGILSDLGSMTGTGITDTLMATMTGGDFDNSGNFVVMATGSKSTVYSINVTTRAVTAITLSTAIQGDDLAFAKGYFYSSFGAYMYKVAVSAGTSWISSSQTIFPSNVSSHDSTYSNGSGQIIFVDGNGNAYLLADPLTATSSSNFVMKYSYSPRPKDGAMCHAAPVPTASPDTSSGGKNVAQTKSLLTNDSAATNAPGVTLVASSVKLCDPNSNPVEVSPNCTKGAGTSITVANVGTYSVDALGVITFTPVNNYLGTPPALNYQVSDSTGNIATSTYTPTVLNTLPTANNDTSSGAYDTNQVISVLINDTAGSLAALDATSVKLCATTSTANASCNLTSLTVPNEGTYTVNANGTVTFDPLPTFSGVASPVKYVVADTTGQLAGATITPTVASPAVPTATPQSKSVIPGGTVAFTTLTGTSGLATSAAGFNTSSTCLLTPSTTTCDADGVVTIANEGTYTLDSATGIVTFVAAANASAGTKTALTYQVTDITGQKATSTLTPIIPPAPTATNDTSSGAWDINQIISPLTNDAAGLGASLVASSVKLCATTSTANASCNLTTLTVANQGTYTVNANGTVTFDPLPTFSGVASPVKYVVADTTGQLAGATITPTVALPAAPVATPESKAVIPGGTATFTTITGTSGLATSGVGLVAASTCLITPASSPAACDSDGIVTIAGQGTYTLNAVTGIVTYVADSAATAGTKTAIAYQVQDIFGQKATSTLTPVIPPAPVATNDTSTGAYDTNQVISILTNDTATSPAILVASTVKLCATTSTADASCNLTTLIVANEGTYTVNANGTVTFDPLPTFKGTASPVKYAVQDSTGQFAGATITPTVSLPALPTATPQTKNLIPGGSATFTTLTGTSGLATSAAGLNATVTCLYTPSTTTCDSDGIVTIAGQGTYTLDAVTGIVTYAADPAATAGIKTAITYQVKDIFGQAATSTLTPTISPAPAATNDTSSGAYDTVQIVSVLANDLPGSGGALVITSVKLCATTATANASCNLTTLTVANEGTYTVNPDGTISFDPLHTFKGTASPVKYVVADTTGQLDDATLTPTVAGPPVPVATPQSKSVIPGGTATFTTITGASGLATSGVGLVAASTCLYTPSTTTCDSDGVVTIANEGTYTLDAATGIVTFAAAVNATAGTKTSITYKVVDITGQTATSTLTPVIPVPPAATNDTSTGAFDTNQTISVLTNDTVTSPATLVASSVKLCATTSTANASCNLTTLTVANQGTYTVNANGTVTFDPLPTFSGVASPVKYVVADTTGQLAGATITPTVALPAAPVATPESKAVIPGGTATFTTITGTSGLATSNAGLNTTLTCLYTPSTTTCDSDGVVTIAGEGTYTLNASTGLVTFVADPAATAGIKTPITYKVVDIFGQTTTATLTPVIPPAPIATNDTSTGAFDTNQVISVLTNDTVTSPATLVASSVKLCATTSTANASCNLTTLTVANEGTYTVNANGTVTFDPLPNFSGVASPVKYVVADTTGQLAGATITPTVSLPPGPVATPDSRAVIPGGTEMFTTITGTSGLATSGVGLNAILSCLYTPGTTTCDSDGIVSIAGEGTYTLNKSTGVVTFTADANATQGAQTSITYQVADIFGQIETSTLTPVIPSPPAAVDDTSSGAFDTNQVISILTNDFATTPATLVASSVKLCSSTSTSNASCNLTTLTVANQGTYTVNANGTVTFDPLPNFTGAASPVKYVVQDNTGQLADATITPSVSLPVVPIATPESKTVLPGATASFTTTTGPSGLAISIAGLDALVTCLYTPGTTTCDSDGVVTIAGQGTYTLDIGTGVVTYVADPAATAGTKTAITYKVVDIFGQTATSTLTPIVPPAPAATNDRSSGPYDTNQTISPLANDSFSSLAPAVISTIKLCGVNPAQKPNDCDKTVVVVPNEGTYTLNAAGTVTFDPLPTFTGTATPLLYQVQDTVGRYVNATITPTVAAPPVPAATQDTGTAKQGKTVVLTPWLNDTAGTVPSDPATKVSLVPTSIRLCPLSTVISMDVISTAQSNPACTLTKLTTVDGTYTVDTKTGKVTFVHKKGFVGTVTQPATYQIANNWDGVTTPQVTTSQLIPTIIGEVATPQRIANSVSIGDKVWRDLNGNGKQGAADFGIAGVKVTLFTAKGKPVVDLLGKIVTSLLTDKDGKYLFTNLPAGQYKVVVTYPAKFRSTIPNRGSREKDSSTYQAKSKVLALGQSDLSLGFGMVPKMTSGLAHTT